jgi:tol-pal system protein YbgF
MPIRSLRLTFLLFLTITAPAFPQAFAGGGTGIGVNKDMVQLQTQVQQLLNDVAHLQQSNDERMGVLKDLVQQSADSVNRMSVTVNALQKAYAAQETAAGAKVDQVSGQVQAINDSLDEVKARMNRLEKLIGNIDSQQQAMNSTLQTLQPPAPATGTTTPPPNSMPDSTAIPGTPPVVAPTAPVTPAPSRSAANSAAPKPLVDDLYHAAYNDFMAARYAVATSEFGDVIKNYPDAPLAGNSYYYLGEIDYRAARYSAAAKSYDHVLEQFPDNNKIPAAHLHKGEALLEMKQREAGILELRALIQRFPNSPEAAQARTKLNGMGVPVKPKP